MKGGFHYHICIIMLAFSPDLKKKQQTHFYGPLKSAVDLRRYVNCS